MDASKYLIIGGGLAGGKAVEGIRKVDAEGAVTLVTAEPHRPYQRPPLSKDYLRGQAELDHVYLREPGFYPENGVELITGARAAALNPATRRVWLEDGRELGYEKLLLATGGRAWRLPLPGNELEGVYTLRTIDDSQRIRAAAATAPRC